MASKLKVNILGDLYSKEFPPQPWIVDHLIPEQAIVLLTAQPASFKTWVVLELLRCVAEGRRFLGEFETAQSAVLLLDEESGERQLYNRFKVLNVDKNLEIAYSSLTGRVLNKDYTDSINRFCNENGVKMVAFDSLTRFHNSEENDASSMSKVMKHFADIKREGFTSLIIHHTRKPSQRNGISYRNASSDIRGSSDIFAACDVHIDIRKVNDGIVLTQTKNRFEPEMKSFGATLERVNDNQSEWRFNGFIDSKETRNEDAKNGVYEIVKNNPGINQKQIIEAAKEKDSFYSESNIRKYLELLLSENKIVRHKGARTEHLYYADLNALPEEEL